MVASVLIISVNRLLLKINIIKHGKALNVTGTHAKDDEIFMFFARIDYLDFLAFIFSSKRFSVCMN